MNPWGQFGQVFLLFGFVVAAVVFIVKQVAQRWIDAQFKVKEIELQQAHIERMAEIANSHKLHQQREQIVFNKTHDLRWEGMRRIAEHLPAIYATSNVAYINLSLASRGESFLSEYDRHMEHLRQTVEAMNRLRNEHSLVLPSAFMSLCIDHDRQANTFIESLQKARRILRPEFDHGSLYPMLQDLNGASRDLEMSVRDYLGAELS